MTPESWRDEPQIRETLLRTGLKLYVFLEKWSPCLLIC